MKKSILIILLLLHFSSALLFAQDKLEVGSKALNFSLLAAGSDQTISLNDFVNKKIVIVHFWKSR